MSTDPIPLPIPLPRVDDARRPNDDRALRELELDLGRPAANVKTDDLSDLAWDDDLVVDDDLAVNDEVLVVE